MTLVCLAGDVMIGRRVDEFLTGESDKSVIWGEALTSLRTLKPSVTIANLETALTTSPDRWPDKRFLFTAHPDNAEALTCAGVQMCSLANNHSLDAMHSGLMDTANQLDTMGISHAGAGPDITAASKPASTVLPNGRRLWFFSWAHPSSFTPRAWAATQNAPGINLLPAYTWNALKQVRQHVHAIKENGDIVVASLHWGSNWSYRVSIRRRWFARRLIDYAGIDVIHGHSSHHPMAIEVYRNRPIIYGCGDLVNDYDHSRRPEYRSDLVLLYFLDLDHDGTLARLDVAPFRIEEMRLVRACDADTNWLCATINAGGHAEFEEPVGRFARLARSTFNTRWIADGGMISIRRD